MVILSPWNVSVLLTTRLVAIYYWFSPDAPPIWLRLFNLYPPFHFAKCCADFILLAYPTYSLESNKYYPGTGYHWADLIEPVYVPMLNISVQPTIYSFAYLAGNTVLLSLIAW